MLNLEPLEDDTEEEEEEEDSVTFDEADSAGTAVGPSTEANTEELQKYSYSGNAFNALKDYVESEVAAVEKYSPDDYRLVQK